MKMKGSQKGFALLELLVVVAIGALLLTGAVTAIFQTTGITMETSTRITALEDIKIVAYSVSKDMRMSSTTTLVDDGPAVDNLSSSWKSYYDASSNLTPNNPWYHQAGYSLSGTEVQRVWQRKACLANRQSSHPRRCLPCHESAASCSTAACTVGCHPVRCGTSKDPHQPYPQQQASSGLATE